MTSARTNEPGYFALSIDGALYALLPSALQPNETLRLTLTETASGGSSLVGAYDGAGMPNMLTSVSVDLPYQTDSTCGWLADAIEMLRASGRPHDVSWWKQRGHIYTLALDQHVMFLPRRDAYAAGYVFVDAEDALTATLNGVALAVSYKPAVLDGDAVPVGEMWVSEAAINHPDSGRKNVVRCKVGSAIAAGDTLVVRYVPLYHLQVSAAPTAFPFVGREDTTVTMVEVD